MSAFIASSCAIVRANSISSKPCALPRFFSEKSKFMSAPFKGIGRRKETPLCFGGGRAPNKQLIATDGWMESGKGGGVGVNEGCVLHPSMFLPISDND